MATIGVPLAHTMPSVAPTPTLARPSIRVEAEPRSRRWLGVLAGALAAGLATGAALAVSGVDVASRPKTGPSAAQAFRAIQRLGPQQSAPQDVSVTFTLDQASLLDLGGRVRYRAVGQAQATVDLGGVAASDIRVRGRRASVHIPAAQLDPPVVDQSRSGVVNRNQRLLPDLLGSDVTASDVQDQVQSQLSDTALTQGVPAVAQQLAIARVRASLRQLGFAAVDVTVA